VVDGGSTMSRIYAIEASTTSLGVIADHRLRVRASQIAQVAAELVAALVRGGVPAPASAAPITGHAIAAERTRWVTAIARDLARAPGRSVVVAGERQPPIVHALVAAINALLGNLGKTVGFTEPVVFEAGQPSHDLAGLVGAIERGEVRSLVVLGGNPAYTAPADLPLAPALQRVERSLYLGLYDNETAHACRVMVPALHSLEDWGDARAYDGTLTPVQPLIEPLFDGRSVADVLHRLLGDPPQPARDRMYTAWGRLFPAVELDAALARGAVAGTGAAHAGVGAAAIAWPALAAATAAVAAPAPLELELRPHPYVHDGRYTNNPWLLELPEPITKLTWDNAAQLSPHTAARLGVHHGDVLALTVSEPPSGPSTRAIPRTVEAPAIVVPGHADDVVTLHTGFGRDGGESTARGIGANAFRLWTTATGFHPPVTAAATGRRHALAVTQVQDQLEGRPDILTGTLRELAAPAMRTELARHREPQPSLYKKFPAAGAQWAMSIDLTTCTGCSACVMACAAENNTPVVGKREVLNRREMHWLRIDRYVLDDGPGAAVAVQPMTCQHCELAPCEYVCPVEATTHSPDGLNEMTYNRCIGTRFCSNNCPYKVRRFNWFDFKVHSGLPVLGKNPNVTVRDRGVMEKCTYCVQRIRRAEIDARIAGQPLGGNAVTTACQQACPTEAIRFGSISDPSSTVSEHRRRPHSYAVLHDQGTRPRTRYLARIRNPNAELDNREGDPGGAREGDLEEDR
jgi:molybdopterin-containing oxidoreductase family iron-sulfur binding subunit